MQDKQKWIHAQAQERKNVLKQRLEGRYQFTDDDPLAILCEAGALLSAHLAYQVEDEKQQWWQRFWQALGFEPRPSIPGGIWATPSNPVGVKPAGLPIVQGAGEHQRIYKLAREIVCSGLQPDIVRIEGEHKQRKNIPGNQEGPTAIRFNLTCPNNTQTLYFGFTSIKNNNPYPVNQLSLYLETRPAIAYALASGTWQSLSDTGWRDIQLPQPSYHKQWAAEQNPPTSFCWLAGEQFWFTTALDNWMPQKFLDDWDFGQNDSLYWLKCELSQPLLRPQGDITMAIDVAPADEDLANHQIERGSREWQVVRAWEGIPEETTEAFLERAAYLFQAYEHLNQEKQAAKLLAELAQQADLNQTQKEIFSAFFSKVAMPPQLKIPLASPADIKAAIYGHFPEVTWLTVKRANAPTEPIVIYFLAYAGNDSELKTLASQRLERILSDSQRLQPEIATFLSSRLIMGLQCQVRVLKPWLFQVAEVNQATMPPPLKAQIEQDFGNLKAPIFITEGENGLEKVKNQLNLAVRATLLTPDPVNHLNRRNLGWLTREAFEIAEIIEQDCFAWPLLENV
jgi:hypothetical protein